MTCSLAHMCIHSPAQSNTHLYSHTYPYHTSTHTPMHTHRPTHPPTPTPTHPHTYTACPFSQPVYRHGLLWALYNTTTLCCWLDQPTPVAVYDTNIVGLGKTLGSCMSPTATAAAAHPGATKTAPAATHGVVHARQRGIEWVVSYVLLGDGTGAVVMNNRGRVLWLTLGGVQVGVL